MKRIFILIFFFGYLLLTAVACSNTEQPNITVEVVISKLSEEQFEVIGTNGLENPKIDDFRKLTFNFKMEHTPGISHKVEIPEDTSWKQSINSIDEIDRYWFGEFSKYDGDKEIIVNYNYNFVFYSKGLSENEMRKAFDLTRINVTWDTDEGKNFEKEYLISDLIEFDNK